MSELSTDKVTLRNSWRRPPVWLWSVGVALCAIVVWVVVLALPDWHSDVPLTSEMTRLRNALLAEVETDAVNWTPGRSPRSFLQEQLPPTELIRNAYAEVAATVTEPGQLAMALALARHLKPVAVRRSSEAIMADVDTAYHQLVVEGKGYCSDFTQVFNALAHAAGIAVREWGMSFDGFAGYGHAFNEIYDDAFSKWIFLDVQNSFYAVDRATAVPLSVLELRQRVLSDELHQVQVRRIVPEKFGFTDDEKALNYYQRGEDAYFLWMGNNVFSYDAHPLVGILTPVSRSLEQLAAIFLGVHPKINLLPNSHNQTSIAKLLTLKTQLLTASAAGVLLSLVFVGLLLWSGRLKRRRQSV